LKPGRAIIDAQNFLPNAEHSYYPFLGRERDGGREGVVGFFARLVVSISISRSSERSSAAFASSQYPLLWESKEPEISRVDFTRLEVGLAI